MFSMHVFLGAIGVCVFVTADNNGTFEKMDFVNAIKQSLRRNNDDYVNMRRGRDLNTTTTNSHTISRDLPQHGDVKAKVIKNNAIDEANRRRAGKRLAWKLVNLDEIITESLSTHTELPKTAATAIKDSPTLRSNKKPPVKNVKIFGHVKRNISKLTGPLEINLTNRDIMTKNALKATRKSANKKRIDKFKKFMSKNKNLLREFLNSQLDTQTQSITDQGLVKDVLEKSVLRNDIRDPGKPDKIDEKEAQLPSPDLLDMAQAKGGRIHRLRAKGRLCYRHVLLPEGPKYDSNGRWYVPEHRLVARHQYDVTPRPKLLLPRCCNCCKKSVLGCE